MAIPESQLEIWSKQGSVTQSANTYATIKRALESGDAAYAGRDFKVFLQGSYCNDTNIYAESDVDVVIRYDGAFFHDLDALPPDQLSAWKNQFPDGTYTYNAFKSDVEAALRASFGGSVTTSTKALKIAQNGSRRNADVVAAFEFRRYYRFATFQDQRFSSGICFFLPDGTRIANFPKQHSDNCTSKHQQTRQNFKPMVRIFKNMRSRLVEDRIIEASTAPSYFIEGLLYNVPNHLFSGTCGQMTANAVDWLRENDRTNFLCT